MSPSVQYVGFDARKTMIAYVMPHLRAGQVVGEMFSLAKTRRRQAWSLLDFPWSSPTPPRAGAGPCEKSCISPVSVLCPPPPETEVLRPNL